MTQETESGLIQNNPPSQLAVDSPTLLTSEVPVPKSGTSFTKIFPHKRCPAGVLLNTNDQFQMEAIGNYGEYSDGEVRLWEDILLPTDTVVEVGANMGVHTVPLAMLAGEVMAFEPQRLMFQILTANVALNSLYNVWTVNAAVGDRQDVINVPCLDPYKFQSYGSLEVDKPNLPGEPTPMMTIDSLNLNKLDLLKLDCEGSELKVLLGAAETLRRLRPWVYLEFTSNREEILQVLTTLGYLCLRHLPEHIDQNNYLKAPVKREHQYASDMILAFPKDRAPRPKMEEGFGVRHQLLMPSTKDVLGTAQEILIVEPYGKPIDKSTEPTS